MIDRHTRTHAGGIGESIRRVDAALWKIYELFSQLRQRLGEDDLARLEENLQAFDELYLAYGRLVGGYRDELLALQHLMAERLQNPLLKSIALYSDLDGRELGILRKNMIDKLVRFPMTSPGIPDDQLIADP